ncbi:hypothetical protein VKT23_014637 [Stygiomarasmius scandens]|uniref:CxC1-like cysteine cluster associated with KDZ transposases domain-containing protein n=1 Tax=Marasmiellus scandens TaxID=2682957 RepID=A0ABR1IZR4_9AGAR
MTSRCRTTKEKPPKLSAAAYRPTLQDPATNPPTRRGPRPLVYLNQGRYLTQNPRLPRLRGQIGLNGNHPAEFEEEHPITAVPTVQETDTNLDSAPLEPFGPETPVSPSKPVHKKKKERQWKRWLKEVIPSLVEPYMELLQRTDNLRLTASLRLLDRCSCNNGRRFLDIVVIRFTGIEKISVWFCSSCCPTAPQLIESGLFPCAPFVPSLCVDVHMLDFLARLFLRISPNVTVWCGALEDFLRQQGYWLQGQDLLRRRFGNCLLWFNSLQDAVRARVKSGLEAIRTEQLQQSNDISGDPPRAPAAKGVSDPDKVTPVANGQQKRKHTEETLVYGPPPPPSLPSRASAYLRSRCAICFGGTSNPKASDQEKAGPRVIVTLDACFMHKHNCQSSRDPPRLHPDTMYIPEDEVHKWEVVVNAARPPKPTKRPKPGQDLSLEDDHYEHGMRVPKSALDGCLGSFTAAQETISSSSSSDKFDKTADAGMFCQHDIALFMVVINSPGERQYYMLALIAELFKHIPVDWTVGILYDIGCQTERSCRKWGFLKEYLKCIIWAVGVGSGFVMVKVVSVAGVVYDTWWLTLELSGIIFTSTQSTPNCISITNRLSGMQQSGYNEKHVNVLPGDLRRSMNCKEAAKTWHFSGFSGRNRSRCRLNPCPVRFTFPVIDKTFSELTSHIFFSGQKRNAAKAAVQEALRLNEALDVWEKRIADLENAILSKTSERYQTVTAYDDLIKARKSRDEAQARLSQKEHSLGTSDKAELRKLMNDPYTTKRLNALAVKTRLRQKLEARKFALTQLERCFRKQRSEQKLHDHTRDSVQRRDPSILTLATKYNNLCSEICHLIDCGKASTHAVYPIKIDKSTLFDLDTNEDIWQNVGLTDNGDQPPPPWMVDENVRKGIRAMLELDRCTEEHARLQIQSQSLQEWFVEEWQILMIALERAKGSIGLRHQLEMRKQFLLRLCVSWEQALVELSDGSSSFWGPSSDELKTVRREVLLDAVGMDEEDDFGGAYLEDVEVGLTEQLDTRDIADSYREMESNDM